MKNTIYDYVDFRGDLSPIDFPYNEIDYLIFSELAYVEFDSIIEYDYHQSYSLKEAFEIFSSQKQNIDDFTYIDSYHLFEKMSHSFRYQNIRIISYINDINPELIKQFSALALVLEDETIAIVYRGTDDALIGWHEDFLMLCESVVPAQESSVQFLEYIATFPYSQTLFQSLQNQFLSSSLVKRFQKHFLYKKKRPFILMGHSKGGNLAMYAGCFCQSSVQDRILKIYNYDGPGFQDEIISSHAYKNMLPRIHSYIPHYSFFGIVLGHEEDYTVVHSHYTGMLQHNGFSWEVGPQHFVNDELSYESVQFAIKVILFLEKLNLDDKHQFISAMFDLFSSLNLYTFSDLSHISYKQILAAIKELTFLEGKVRKMLIEVLHMLWLEAKKTKKE